MHQRSSSVSIFLGLYVTGIFFSFIANSVDARSREADSQKFNVLSDQFVWALTERAAVNFKNRVHHTQCQVDKLTNSNKPILFAFEGFFGSNKKAFAFRKAWVELSAKPIIRNYSHLKRDSSRRQFKHLLLKYTLTPLTHSTSDILNLVWAYYPSIPLDNHALYFSHSELSEAKDCLFRLLRRSRKLEKLPVIKIIGKSFGGDSALKLAKFSIRKGVLPKHLITIDPVLKKKKHLARSLFGKGTSLNTGHRLAYRHVNFYQLSDSRSLLLGVKGTSLPWAHEDILIRISGKKGKRMHQDIAYHQQVTTEVRRLCEPTKLDRPKSVPEQSPVAALQ